jgi:hypothetical protein
MQKKYKFTSKLILINTNGSLYFSKTLFNMNSIQVLNDLFSNKLWKKNIIIFEKQKQISTFISKFKFFDKSLK